MVIFGEFFEICADIFGKLLENCGEIFEDTDETSQVWAVLKLFFEL